VFRGSVVNAKVELDEQAYISEFPFSVFAALAAPWILWAVVSFATPPEPASALNGKAAVPVQAQPLHESIDPVLPPPRYEVRL
jgi:hypothetical protein